MASIGPRLATSARLATLALLWGSGFLLIKIALEGFTPYQIVLARLALGTLVLLAFMAATREPLPRGRAIWLHLSAAALLANIVPYLLFAIAEQQIDSAVAGVINATTPILTVLVAVLTRHEPMPTRARLAGLLVGIAGTVVLFAPWKSGTQFTSWGAIAALAASLSYAITYVYMDRYLVSRHPSAVGLSASQLLAATTITAIALPVTRDWTVPTWRLDATLSLAALGILGTGVAYVLNYRIIAEDGASAASVVTYLLPITAVILGAIVLNEKPTLRAIVGMLIVLAGVALARRGVVTRAVAPIAQYEGDDDRDTPL